MTNEEAKAFLDNLKICINEHPIVADWLVEIADRKTEPIVSEIPTSSEKPNSCTDCEYWNDTEDGCADRHGCRATTEDCSTVPTSSKMEQVPNCIDCTHYGDYEVCKGCDDDYNKFKSYYEPKDEPRTERSE